MDASVLNRLDEIETAAQKVRAQTEDRKRELEKAADQKTAAFDAQIDADSAKKLDALRAQMQDQDRSRLDRLEREADAQFNRINEYYAAQLDSRADAIVKQVLE